MHVLSVRLDILHQNMQKDNIWTIFLKSKFPDSDFASQYLYSIVTFHLTLTTLLKFFHPYCWLKIFHLTLAMLANINFSLLIFNKNDKSEMIPRALRAPSGRTYREKTKTLSDIIQTQIYYWTTFMVLIQ